ncbi:MAG: spore germination protein [Clostridia bacterium]|nr:spore germination protein [Clostridia bacterium]
MINETNIDIKRQRFDKALRIDASFDAVRRDIITCGKKCSFYFIDGLTKDEVMLRIMDLFMKLKELDLSSVSDLKAFYDTYIPYVEVEGAKDGNAVVTGVLSGMTAMIVDGIPGAVLIDCRTYPVRGIEEPENDKVLRGARVGFVETLVFNAALIRRHIRDARLSMKIKTVGTSSKTDVVLCYLDGVADKKLLSRIEQKIDSIKVPSLSLGSESLAECLIKTGWYNPFPKIRYTERPDAAAASIMEGSIIVLCDNSPSAMILPTCIFDFLQETDDYYFPPLTGTYLRFVRCFVFFLTMFLSPLWYLLITHPEYIPEWLGFITVESESALPIIVQLFLLEFAVDGLKLAALNTPSVLAGSFSIIGGLILGDFAVKVGWFVPETILYTAFVSIANFAQPSYELGYAFKFMRLILLALTALFAASGFIFGVLLSLVLIASNKTVDGQRHYLYPLFPFNARALSRLILRRKLK